MHSGDLDAGFIAAQADELQRELPLHYAQRDGTVGLDTAPSQRARGFSELHALARQGDLHQPDGEAVD